MPESAEPKSESHRDDRVPQRNESDRTAEKTDRARKSDERPSGTFRIPRF